VKAGRKPKSRDEEPKPIPLAIASVPDRRLGLLGGYVRFLQAHFENKEKLAARGEIGIIVSDAKGICKEGRIAVRVHRHSRKDADYLAVPIKILQFLRGKP
jgi:hypothetical protein